jgi:hypothetical protein
MKKIILSLIAMLTLSVAIAQSAKYVTAMKKNIAGIDSAFKNKDFFITLTNNFERIATAEKNAWLPYYYAALCKINYGFMQKDMSGNDVHADAAEIFINKADSLAPLNSEISCAKSMLASLRMLVNPQQRFMQYGTLSEKALKLAIAQDSTNPRPHFLKGQGLKGTPEQFGGGCKVAKAHLQMAVDKYATFKPATDISPNWGKDYATLVLKECEK